MDIFIAYGAITQMNISDGFCQIVDITKNTILCTVSVWNLFVLIHMILQLRNCGPFVSANYRIIKTITHQCKMKGIKNSFH